MLNIPIMIRFLLITMAFLAIYHCASARADSGQIGAFQSWTAYVSHNRGQDMCYISSRPINTEGKNHAGVFAEVTHRPSEHHTGVIDILGGYTFKAGTPATLSLGGKDFALFTHGEAAFAQDADDEKIVAAMRAADTMVFSGTDKKGNVSKASFNLKGMEQAYEAISKACKVQIPPAPRKAKK